MNAKSGAGEEIRVLHVDDETQWVELSQTYLERIGDLLQHARDEETEQSNVSLQESATDAWKTVTSEDAKLVLRDEAEFMAYPSQLRRVFENLFWNAIDHGDATEIRVGLLGEDGFYVEDDGCGIPAAERDVVFDAGYSTSETGTGYGLHIVRSLSKMHDWTISITTGDGGGARFEISGVTVTHRVGREKND